MMRSNYSMEELLPLLEKQIRRFTMGDSTSVPYDKARQLMASIVYCIDGAFQDEKGMLPMQGIPPQEAFRIGLEKRKKHIGAFKGLYESIKESFIFFGNLCYKETVVDGMEEFFLKYDLEFDALNSIITLDYPLMGKRLTCQGIDLIYEYLRKVELEQLFMRKYNEADGEKILLSYDSEYKENIFNLCSPLLRNSLGKLLVNGNPFGPMTEIDLDCIEEAVKGRTKAELMRLLEENLQKLVSREYGESRELYEYLLNDISDFAFELQEGVKTGHIGNVLPVYGGENKDNAEWYEDGTSMKDEELRSVIEEMKDCRYTEDKLSILCERMKSLEDFKEIAGECFEEREYPQVFSLLSIPEIQKLKEEILLKQLFSEELMDWERYIIG